MPKPIKLKIILKTLRAKGFIKISQKGSHAKFRKKGKTTKTVIVPVGHKEIPFGTFHSILSQAGLEEKDFRK